MENSEINLVLDLVQEKISSSEMVRHFAYLDVPIADIPGTLLKREIEAKDADGIECVFYLAGHFGLSSIWLPLLRGIALQNWHREQEEIAVLLGDHCIPGDVPLLLQMAFAKFEHLQIEGDEPLLIKCMQALGKFDCHEALEALAEIAKVDNVDVAEQIDFYINQVRNRIDLKAQNSG